MEIWPRERLWHNLGQLFSLILFKLNHWKSWSRGHRGAESRRPTWHGWVPKMTLVPTFPDAHAVQLPLNSAKHSALPTGWLKTIRIYCLTALVARNIPSRCRQAWFLLMALRENPSPVSLPVSGGCLQSVACSCGPVSYSSHVHTVSWLPRDTGVSPILLHGSLYFRSHPWRLWSAVSSPPQRRLILLGTVAILTCGVSLPCLSVPCPHKPSHVCRNLSPAGRKTSERANPREGSRFPFLFDILLLLLILK